MCYHSGERVCVYMCVCVCACICASVHVCGERALSTRRGGNNVVGVDLGQWRGVVVASIGAVKGKKWCNTGQHRCGSYNTRIVGGAVVQ